MSAPRLSRKPQHAMVYAAVGMTADVMMGGSVCGCVMVDVCVSCSVSLSLSTLAVRLVEGGTPSTNAEHTWTAHSTTPLHVYSTAPHIMQRIGHMYLSRTRTPHADVRVLVRAHHLQQSVLLQAHAVCDPHVSPHLLCAYRYEGMLLSMWVCLSSSLDDYCRCCVCGVW